MATSTLQKRRPTNYAVAQAMLNGYRSQQAPQPPKQPQQPLGSFGPGAPQNVQAAPIATGTRPAAPSTPKSYAAPKPTDIPEIVENLKQAGTGQAVALTGLLDPGTIAGNLWRGGVAGAVGDAANAYRDLKGSIGDVGRVWENGIMPRVMYGANGPPPAIQKPTPPAAVATAPANATAAANQPVVVGQSTPPPPAQVIPTPAAPASAASAAGGIVGPLPAQEGQYVSNYNPNVLLNPMIGRQAGQEGPDVVNGLWAHNPDGTVKRSMLQLDSNTFIGGSGNTQVQRPNVDRTVDPKTGAIQISPAASGADRVAAAGARMSEDEKNVLRRAMGLAPGGAGNPEANRAIADQGNALAEQTRNRLAIRTVGDRKREIQGQRDAVAQERAMTAARQEAAAERQNKVDVAAAGAKTAASGKESMPFESRLDAQGGNLVIVDKRSGQERIVGLDRNPLDEFQGVSPEIRQQYNDLESQYKDISGLLASGKVQPSATYDDPWGPGNKISYADAQKRIREQQAQILNQAAGTLQAATNQPGAASGIMVQGKRYVPGKENDPGAVATKDGRYWVPAK